MSNKYGVTQVDGSPSQKNIDAYLNWCDNNPPNYAADIQKFNKQAKDKIKKQLEDLKKEAQQMLDDTIKPPLDGIKKEMEPIEPLIEPPSSLDDCLNFCKNVAKYFLGPYQKLVALIAFWTQYTTACIAATNGMIARIVEQQAALQSDPTGENTKQ